MAERGRAVGVAVLIMVAAVPGLGLTAAPASGAGAGPTILRSVELSLTPGEPGTVQVEVSYTVPDTVKSIQTTLPSDSSAVESSGFENIGNTTWQWERGDGTPVLRFELAANQTGSGATLSRVHDAGNDYVFVDTGPWAIIEVPRMPTQWVRSGPPVLFDERVTIDGPGATGGEMAYLGPYELYTRTAHDQRFRLVVPAAAELAPDPTAILESLAFASDRLRVGERDDSVLMIAAPASVSWGPRGLAGGSDGWVVANESLAQAFNPWVHEYVHTRQAYPTTRATQWTIEATATYYAALLTLQEGRIDYAAFRSLLADGGTDPVVDSRLVNPATWQGLVPYLKGGLVWGAFDYRLRRASDATRSAAELLGWLNGRESPVTQSEFLQAAAVIAGERGAGFLQEYTTARTAPSTWDREAHVEAFDVEPPRFAYELPQDAVRVTGPYRTMTGIPSTVVVGETLSVSATVTNVGELAGPVDTQLRLNGRTVDVVESFLEPGSSRTITLNETLKTPGIVRVSVGSERFRIRVAEPATPVVTSLSANRTTIEEDDSVTLTVTLTNKEEWPARGTIPVTVDGERVANVTTTLESGQSETVTLQLRIEDDGTRTIAVGDRNLTVTVARTGVAGPGFGILPGVAALVLVAGWALVRRAGEP
ncbi:MAG: CARDB domain-containing protein [Halobacteriaceae archaeon]